MSRFTLKWVDGQYKVSLPGIGTMDVVPAAEFDELLVALQDACEFIQQFQYEFNTRAGERDLKKYQALIAKHGGGV